jgi:hypothetical protein
MLYLVLGLFSFQFLQSLQVQIGRMGWKNRLLDHGNSGPYKFTMCFILWPRPTYKMLHHRGLVNREEGSGLGRVAYTKPSCPLPSPGLREGSVILILPAATLPRAATLLGSLPSLGT